MARVLKLVQAVLKSRRGIFYNTADAGKVGYSSCQLSERLCYNQLGTGPGEVLSGVAFTRQLWYSTAIRLNRRLAFA